MGYHGTHTTHEGPVNSLFLDRFNHIGVALSLRKLRNSYLGPCIRVRRSSDNAEMDIGFVNNKLDVATLLSFCRSDSGFIRTWYDQSTFGYNAVQTTTSSQPRIVNAGVLETNRGYPCIQFNSHLLQITYTGFSSINYLVTFNVYSPNAASANDVANFQLWSYAGGGPTATPADWGIQWGVQAASISLEHMAMYFSNPAINGGRLGKTSARYSHAANELCLGITGNTTGGSFFNKNYGNSITSDFNLSAVMTGATNTAPSNTGSTSTNVWIKSTNGAVNAITNRYHELIFCHDINGLQNINFRQIQNEILNYYNLYTSSLLNGAS